MYLKLQQEYEQAQHLRESISLKSKIINEIITSWIKNPHFLNKTFDDYVPKYEKYKQQSVSYEKMLLMNYKFTYD